MSRLLVIFARNPELGKTKTRLAKTLGDETSLAIYYKLINHAQQITNELPLDVAVYYSSFIDKEDSWDNKRFFKRLQKGNDLGEKMFNAIKEGFEMGYREVLLIGTDIYSLTDTIIMDGFEKLLNSDVVIGPAVDGGYYLIGMKKPHQSIFKLDEWSHSQVFSETLELLKEAKLSFSETFILNDIDEETDLVGTDLELLLKKNI